MLKLEYIFKDNKLILVELLIISTHVYPNKSLFDTIVARLPENLYSDSYIKTIIAYAAIKENDTKKASEIISVSYSDVSNEYIFKIMWIEVVRQLIIKDNEFADKIDFSVLANLITSYTEPNKLYDFLYDIITLSVIKWKIEFFWESPFERIFY